MGLAASVELLPAGEAAGQPGGDLRIPVVQFKDAVGDECVAAAIGGIEAGQIGPEGANQCVDLVRVADVEGRVGGERLHGRQRIRAAAGRLHL